MGWSYRAEAGETMAAWKRACLAQTGQQNVYISWQGKRYFWEPSRIEHADGSITGAVFAFTDEDHAREAGYFQINGDGTVESKPVGLIV